MTDPAPAERRARPRGSVLATVVGVVGELLITLGVLVGLFVVWQLWWTDVVAEREQAAIIADLDWAWTPERPRPTPEAEPTQTPPVERRDAAPVPAVPAYATTFATLHVPRWGLDYQRTISEGTGKSDVLDVLGLGHYEGTAMPGAIGNFAVAGHRVTYGKPLNRVEELQVGDPLIVQTEQAWYVYRVTETRIVRPSQVEVLLPTPSQPDVAPTQAVLTLTTCHPMYSARDRFVVHATLDYWMEPGDTPVELQGGA